MKKKYETEELSKTLIKLGKEIDFAQKISDLETIKVIEVVPIVVSRVSR